MSALFHPIPEARTLSVMPTYKCTAHCRHCGTYSGPGSKVWLEEDLILDAIRQAAGGGFKVVVFTGGEPTLAWETVLRGISLASELGLGTRIVTNASWATSVEEADRVMETLVAAGLDEVNFSTGDQHARFVPVDNVVCAAGAAARLKLMTIAIMIETVADRTISARAIESRDDMKALRTAHPGAVIRLLESPWMPLSPSRTERYPGDLAVTESNLPLQGGCTSCLSTITLQADGRIAACCGLGMRSIPELQLGHIADTTLAEAEARGRDDMLKRWIRVEGPEQILAWAARHDPSITWTGQYAHRCQSCLRLYRDEKVRRVIREHHREKLADVMFREWLLFHYQPAAEGPQPSPAPAEPA